MIPTREQIVSWSNMAVAWSYEKGVVETPDSSRVGLVNERLVLYRGEVDNAANWISSMRDEIDRLTAELKVAHDDEVAECERADRNANTMAQLRKSLVDTDTDLDKANAALAKAGWTRDGAEWKPPLGPNPSPLLERIDRLTAELAALKPSEDLEALAKALAERDANARHRDDLVAMCRKWEVMLAEAGIKRQMTVSDGIAELIRQRDEFRSLTKPPNMVARIESLAESMLSESVDNPGNDPAFLGAIDDRIGTDDERFLVLRRDITAAVALMRSAGDGKALLREMRAWLGKTWFDDDVGEWIHDNVDTEMIAERIDEMLAQPAPVEKPTSTPYIPTSVFPPQYLTQKPAAAVPDDPRWELVAQLADAIVTMCDGQGFGVTLSEVQAIAANLRGGA